MPARPPTRLRSLTLAALTVACTLASPWPRAAAQRLPPAAPRSTVRPRSPTVLMIRNVDEMECLLVASPVDADVCRIADEAMSDGAAVAVGSWLDGGEQLAAGLRGKWGLARVHVFGRECSFTHVRQQLLVLPSGFGGSDGFGSKPRECERAPLPARSVVLTSDCQCCVEAMESGMRCIGVVQEDWTGDDVKAMDRVADVLLDDLVGTSASEWSTPGAFWLNPPLPRSEEGEFLPDPDESVAPCRRSLAANMAPSQPGMLNGSPHSLPASASEVAALADDGAYDRGEGEAVADESFVDEIDDLRF
ncbi:hypothetical protein T492DRAFT_1152572 [Pavlovales sp. CCMP2436]|nr:hypothetical protein T492DRAFT_1152572 [Pavlovales sp. CCMP2436]|mmetsp:Transcript_12522/g.31726  ORF Transcript_12522/g.31726 Transcript_12522/m.31726 type:complete len:305 (+) Transcript_12522:177-1091(+)